MLKRQRRLLNSRKGNEYANYRYKKPDTVDFGMIKISEVFFAEKIEEYGSNPYMRIFKIETEDEWYNAVDLSDGTTIYFGDNEKVIKCEACLTIR